MMNEPEVELLDINDELVTIPGWPDYAVTRNGQVFSYKSGEWKELKPRKRISNRGKAYERVYYHLILSQNGKHKNKLVHRLVAMTFLSDYSEELLVDHINKNSTDNRISNLRMATSQGNNRNRKDNEAAGVTWNKRNKRWKVQLVNPKTHEKQYFGCYIDREEAEIKAAEIREKFKRDYSECY